jgi:2,5-diketo-D-gluconate reductase B
MHMTAVKDVQVPSIGLGTWQLDGDDCEQGVAHALEVGYRHLDTAQMYGNEDRVGAALAASSVDRGDVFLTTKLGVRNLTPDRVRPSVEDSLRKLRTEYVDLLLIHWPKDGVDPRDTIRSMVALADEGKVRHVGVSNYPPSWFAAAQEVTDVFCNQVEYHPYLAQGELCKLAVEQDFLLTAYSPLARGQVLDDETLTEIGEEHNAGPAQVAIRWLIQQDHVAAIPKATSRTHIESNLRAQDLELTDDEMQRIAALNRDERLIDPGFVDDWER